MSAPSSEKVTRILEAAQAGEPKATEDLLPLVYDELRGLANRQMSKELPGQTLQPTALVHEAYLRLIHDPDVSWESRGHFFSAAARAMRQILIERARRAGTLKRGGEWMRVSLEPAAPASGQIRPDQLLALDEALHRLDRIDPRKGRIVMLRYFAGLSIDDTARALGLSLTTVKDEWRFARSWLSREIGDA